MIYRIEETTSTNDDARDAKYRHGDGALREYLFKEVEFVVK